MRVLIAYDGSAHADRAIDDLVRAGLPTTGEAIVVSVAHRGWPGIKQEDAIDKESATPWKATIHEAAALAEKGRLRFQSHFPQWSASCEALWGDPATMLLKTIDVWKPGLVAVGSHGRSFAGRLLLGSVSTDLVHHAPCSVRVIRTQIATDRPIRILIGTDGSPQAEAAVDAVATRAWPEGTEIRVLAVVQTLVPQVTTPALEAQTFATEPAYQIVEAADARERVRLVWAVDAAADRLRRAGLEARAMVVDSDPRHEIAAEAARWHADSIFVGARGLSTLDRLLLGSVSGAIVRNAHCAVEIVRA